MSALFLLFLLFLTACLVDTTETILFVSFPELAASLGARYGRAAVLLDFGSWAALILAGILWMGLLGLAVRGSTWRVPVLKQLSERKWIIRVSSTANSVVLVLIPLVAIFAVHATSLTRRNTDGASVYFLYDEGVGVPRWGFALGLYRISIQARRNWGKGSTVLDCLNRQTLHTALANAKVLIIATHGGDGYATTWYAPEVLRIEPPETGASDESKSPRFLRARVLGRDGQWSTPDSFSVNAGLKLAYIFACDGGAKAAQWKEHLAPAQVITYDRVSTVWDHAVWFAFTGPPRVATLR